MNQGGANRRTLIGLSSVVFVMTALAFASVPFYDWFCRVTGFAGETVRAETNVNKILDHTIRIRFDGSIDSGLAWEFKPVQKEMTIKVGETGIAFYEAYNPTNQSISGAASYNVFPFSAGSFFTKIDCFCFEEQILAPGERIQMPVTFYVDPEIMNDSEGKFIEQITLSYTFYKKDYKKNEQAVLTKPTKIEFN
jgi:cytochrome c oxidase assembly protein subunit 11